MCFLWDTITLILSIGFSQHFHNLDTRASLTDAAVTPVNRRGRHSSGHSNSHHHHDTHKRSGSPPGCSPAPTSFFSSSNPSGFSNGAHSQRSPAVCTVCLGRNCHSFVECAADQIWDNSRKVVSKRLNRQLLLCSNDKPLCVDWQRGRGCTTSAISVQVVCYDSTSSCANWDDLTTVVAKEQRQVCRASRGRSYRRVGIATSNRCLTMIAITGRRGLKSFRRCGSDVEQVALARQRFRW
jgi:hypothetical protein